MRARAGALFLAPVRDIVVLAHGQRFIRPRIGRSADPGRSLLLGRTRCSAANLPTGERSEDKVGDHKEKRENGRTHGDRLWTSGHIHETAKTSICEHKRFCSEQVPVMVDF